MSVRSRTEVEPLGRANPSEALAYVVGPGNWAAVAAIERFLAGGQDAASAIPWLVIEGPPGSGRTALLERAAARPNREVVRVAGRELPGRGDGRVRQFMVPVDRSAGRTLLVIDDIDQAVGRVTPGLPAFFGGGGRMIATAREESPGLLKLYQVLLAPVCPAGARASLFPPPAATLEAFLLGRLRTMGFSVPDGVDLARRLSSMPADFRCAEELAKEVEARASGGVAGVATIEQAFAAAGERWKPVTAAAEFSRARRLLETALGSGPTARHALAFVLRSRTRLSLRAIADVVGVRTGSAAFKGIQKIDRRVRLDPSLRRAIDEAERAIGTSETRSGDH